MWLLLSCFCQIHKILLTICRDVLEEKSLGGKGMDSRTLCKMTLLLMLSSLSAVPHSTAGQVCFRHSEQVLGLTVFNSKLS